MKNQIAELICTKISHDIMGSIGAVGNASELLAEGDMDFIEDIKSILQTSFDNLSSRMKFFRLTFGVDNTNLEDAALVEKTARDYLATLGAKEYPITLQWGKIDAEYVKTALLTMMILADMAIRGGSIKVAQDSGFIAAGIAKSGKISQDKWQKMLAIIQQNDTPDANTAAVAALKEMAGGENIRLIDNDEIYGIAVKVAG